MTRLQTVLFSTFLTYVFLVVNLVFADDCGIRKRVNLGRIVGGRPASRNEFPWTVALQRLEGDEYIHFCGAAVINERWIITAAHCLYNRNISRMRAVFGTTDLTNESEFGFMSKLEKSISHHAYRRETFENDIALIKTRDKIPIDANKKNINNICLPENNEEFFGRAYVSGWGRIDEDDLESDILKVLKINLYDDTDCKEFYNETFYPPLMLCAGFFRGRRDACQGDSGGPLEIVMHERSYLIGIVSFGRGCGRENSPGVYTEVPHYVNWIRRRLEEEGEKTVTARPTEKPVTTAVGNKHNFRVVNHCRFNVWMSTLGNWGKSTPANGGFMLRQNEDKSFDVEREWVGRFWGRTACENGICATGDCGRGTGGCQGAGGMPPATLIEMVMDVNSGERDVYSISLLDGFNLPMSIRPIAGFRHTTNNEFDCKPAGCYKNINENCPQDLAVYDQKGKIVACKSACLKTQEDKFCCRKEYLKESKCLESYASNNYLSHFNHNCPRAKTILFDARHATFTCTSNPLTHYEIVFCPAS